MSNVDLDPIDFEDFFHGVSLFFFGVRGERKGCKDVNGGPDRRQLVHTRMEGICIDGNINEGVLPVDPK